MIEGTARVNRTNAKNFEFRVLGNTADQRYFKSDSLHSRITSHPNILKSIAASWRNFRRKIYVLLFHISSKNLTSYLTGMLQ